MARGGSASHQPSETNKILTELAVVTLPAVILYFFGWAYLHFYLDAFDINLSELDLDIQTIFVFSYPPLRALARSYWGWLLAVAFAVIIIAVCVRKLAPASWAQLSRFYSHTRKASPVIKAFTLLTVLATAVVISVPLIRATAVQAAMRKWSSEGTRIEALLKEKPEIEFALARQLSKMRRAASARADLCR